MKRFTFILTLLIAMSVIYQSCRYDNVLSTNYKEETLDKNLSPVSKSSEKLELTTETFNVIGETHNNALDYIYDEHISNIHNIKYEDINNSSIYFMFNLDQNMKLTSDNPEGLNSTEHKAKAKFIVENSELLSMSDIILKYNTISLNQKKYIDLLDIAVKNSSLEYHEVISNIELIEKNAILELRDDEIVYFLCVSSVAKHSIEYWNTSRGQKWFNAYNLPFTPIGTFNSNPQAKINWRNVAIADIIGFAGAFPAGITTGMVAGGLAAGVASGGTLAAVGAVLGGLVGGTCTGLAGAAAASALRIAAEQIASIWD